MKLTQVSTPVQLLDYVNDGDTNFWKLTLHQLQDLHRRVSALTDEQIRKDCYTIGLASPNFYIELRDIYAPALAKEIELKTRN